MRRKFAALFVLASTAAGCSLLVEFDREKIPGLTDVLPGDDASAPDARADATGADGTVDAPADSTVTDAPVDSPVDAPADASDGGTDAADAHDAADANVADANDGAAAVDANDGAAAVDANDAASAVDADDGSVADADDGAVDAPADANGSVHCTQAEFDGNDLTAQAAVAITFPTGFTAAQYSPNCIKVKAGTVVTFSGAFANHPLTRTAGSPVSSPIPASTSTASDGGGAGDLPITFPDPGYYDFNCGNHPLAMFGAVQVVP